MFRFSVIPWRMSPQRAAGARPVLLRTGYGRQTENEMSAAADIEVYDDLAAAASALIARHGLD